MSETIAVGDVVAAVLARSGVEVAFGVISIHNMPMLDAIGRGNAIRFVPARGEAGAANMADAYARVGGRLGVVFTSTGPGAGNAAGSLLEARMAGSPLLHLTGNVPLAMIGAGRYPVHDVPDQLAMLKSVSKAAYRVEAPEAALDVLTRAATEALTPPMGPVSVELPIDVQKASVPYPEALETLAPPAPPPPAPAAAALDALADMAAGARRPLLWLGNGARHARAAVMRLVDLGFGVVTSIHGRAVLPEDHPMTLGAFGVVAAVEAFYDTVDLMVIAGSRLRGHETRDQALALPARRCRIDVDPAAEGRGYACDLFVRGDAALALSGLAERLGGRLDVDPAFAADLAATRAAAIAQYREDLGVYAELCDRVRAAVPRDAVWARDITLCNSSWGNRLFPVYEPGDSVYSVLAAIGQGMQMGIGACFAANGRKVVTMCGDGGFFLNVAELWTAVQENVDITLMVMNDSGYGVIRMIQDAFYDGRHYYTDLAMPDLGEFAAAARVPFWRAASLGEVTGALEAALAVDGPALVEVDMAALGPFPETALPPSIRPQRPR